MGRSGSDTAHQEFEAEGRGSLGTRQQGSFSVLLVEDNPGDVELAKNALREVATPIELEVAWDGAEAMEKLRASEPGHEPDLVLLDLKLPKKSGVEVLSEIKTDPRLRYVPVVVLTSSRDPGEVAAVHKLQATACFTKPMRGTAALIRRIIEFVRAMEPVPRTTGEDASSPVQASAPRSDPDSTTEVEELAAIVRSSADAIISTDPSGTIKSWNAAAERLYGYTAREAIGRHVTIVLPEEIHTKFERDLDAHDPTRPLRFESTRIDRDGRRIELGLVVSPMKSPSGARTGHCVIARDISEPRQAQHKFELAVEASASAMVMVDAEGTIVLVNAEAERQFGYSRGDLIGQPLKKLVPERFRSQHPALRAEFHRDPKSRAMGAGRDLFGLRADGTEFPVEIGLNPVRTADGFFVLASVLDITERKQAELRFRLAVEASPSGIAMVDSRGIIVLVNAETERLFGYGRNELVGMPIDELVPIRFRGQHRLHREGFQESPKKRVMGSGRALYGLRKDGTTFPVEIGLNPIETPEGMVTLSTIVDITERMQAQAALARQTTELERSNADLEQFAYVASHDLQEPLRMVASYTDLLASRYEDELDEKALKFIRYAQDGASRMQRLIDDLLAYSRVRTRRKEPHPVDSEACLAHALHDLSVSLAEAGAKVENTPLPRVLADETQLTEVFQNLIHNAIKFRSEAAPRVHVTATTDDGLCTFRVRDNGIGVAEEHFERIFQVFQRLHSRDEYPGTGIGLALCKRVVEQFGGTIAVEGNAEGGATFVFTVPCA